MENYYPYIFIAVLLTVYLVNVPVMVIIERKLSAWLQYRVGPNRVGPFGLMQPMADAIKFFSKEDIIPTHVNRWLYLIAPALMVFPAFFVFAVIPWGVLTIGGKDVLIQIGHTNIGILFMLAISSLTVYSISFGAWTSSKYSYLGGLRAAAQMISYELPMGMIVVSVVLMAGSLQLEKIVQFQADTVWMIFWQPVGAIVFIITVFAETNRLPFDLPESEAELVGGYHTEYSSMKFAMFYMGEYCNMLTAATLITLLYLGGWHVPFLSSMDLAPLTKQIIQIGGMFVKVGFIMFFFVWMRWSLPRFRYDQLMNLGWKWLIPLALANLILAAIIMAIAN
jgi:NADH-quinone oxidoreductase subunit H